MNRAENKLLNDVLAESSDFRATLLGETLRRVRRRKHLHQMQHAAAIVVVIILTGSLFWQNQPRQISLPPVAKKIFPRAYQLVRTKLLPLNEIMTTETFSGTQLVASSASVVEIETTSGNFRRINDAELLALAANRPAILIRTGPNSEKLILANPVGKNDTPIN